MRMILLTLHGPTLIILKVIWLVEAKEFSGSINELMIEISVILVFVSIAFFHRF